MGLGGRGEACKLTPCGETRLRGDAAAETFSSRRTPAGDFGLAAGTVRRAGVSPRGSPPRAGKARPARPSAGRRGRAVGGGSARVGSRRRPEGLAASARASRGRGWAFDEPAARAGVCPCARAGRVPLPLTKLRWSSRRRRPAPSHAPRPCLRRRRAQPRQPRSCSLGPGGLRWGRRAERALGIKMLPAGLTLAWARLQTRTRRETRAREA